MCFYLWYLRACGLSKIDPNASLGLVRPRGGSGGAWQSLGRVLWSSGRVFGSSGGMLEGCWEDQKVCIWMKIAVRIHLDTSRGPKRPCVLKSEDRARRNTNFRKKCCIFVGIWQKSEFLRRNREKCTALAKIILKHPRAEGHQEKR